jgi:putative CocE/NonD family hydrolase
VTWSGSSSSGRPELRILTEFPRPVRVVLNEWIELSDGCRLSARLWLPEDALADPVPAILEYIPYRKDDGTAVRDAPMHSYFAGHGYAAIRVDMRGSGDSDGILEDEYLPLEQRDGLEVLRWIAAQPWCTGRVGIIGKSWGGFNGLQIAAHDPPELGAVISVCSTDDRYADDVHYMGGCLLAWTMLPWATTMLAYNAQPADPAVVGERWRAMWLDRLERTPTFVDTWVSHQRRDDYWKQGSVCEDYGALRCPVFMVGGWADGYSNAILRFLENHPGVCQGLIGPWGHVYPHDGGPGPAIGFLQEAVRWWDHWLRGIDNEIMDEPKLRVWVQEAVLPSPGYPERRGRWVGESGWPAPTIDVRRFGLGDRGLLMAGDGQAVESAAIEWQEAETVGADAGVWCPRGGPTDFPPDQRAEDGRSLTFTSGALDAPAEIVGFPELHVTLATDRPQALLAVRLCDVWPDGHSTLITRGALNLSHRHGHEQPTPLVPGERYAVAIRLNAIAYVVPAGHRLRLALSTTYWPWLWPSPEPVRLQVFAGPETYLELPLRTSGADYQPPAHFTEPESGPPLLTRSSASASPAGRRVSREVGAGTVEIVNEPTHMRPVEFLDTGTTYAERGRDVHRIIDQMPLSASTTSERSVTIARGDWRTRVQAISTMSSTREAYHVTSLLEAYEGDVRVFARTWSAAIPRDGT